MNAAQIAEFYEVDESAVVKWRLVDGGANVRALINYGGGGIKVFVRPVDDFYPKEQTTPAAIPFERADYRALQAMAKEAGIPANQSKDDLISELEIHYAFEEEE